MWVYPFGEYCDAAQSHPDAQALPCAIALDRIFNEDFFLGEALQGGLPLNTVVSTANWRAWVNGGASRPGEPSSAGIFILPVSALLSPANFAALEAWEARGARFLIYGSLAGAPQALLSRLGLSLAEPLTGEFEVVGAARRAARPGSADFQSAARDAGDTVSTGALAARIRVTPALDGGGLCEVLAAPHADAATAERAEASLPNKDAQALYPDAQALYPDAQALSCASSPSGARRVLAARRGAFAYVRSVTPCDGINLENRRHFDYAPPTQIFPVERLMRAALAALSGWSFAADLPTPVTPPPRTNLSRHDNAFLFHIYTPDTTASLRVRTPYGAPLLTERETLLRGGEAIWHPDKSWRRECRLFADGQTEGVVSVKTGFAAYPGFAGHLQVKGLENATLRFFPPADFAGSRDGGSTVELVRSNWNMLAEPVAPEWEDTPDGPCAVWRNVTGDIFIGW